MELTKLRVRVDFNARNADGLVRVRADRVGSLQAGARVAAYDPKDGIEAPAQLVRFNDQGTLAFFQVAWDHTREIDDPPLIWLGDVQGLVSQEEYHLGDAAGVTMRHVRVTEAELPTGA